MHTFTSYKVNLDGSLSHRENLSHDEVSEYMHRVYGKFATVKVVRDDGNSIVYTDNGAEWEKVSCHKGEAM